MIGAIQGTGTSGTGWRSRRSPRVEPTESSAKSGTGAGQSDRHSADGRALLVLEPVARSGGYGRPAHSAPFIAQLAAAHLGESSGERRTRRDPATVAPRAQSAYGHAARLSTDLEVGFLVIREA